MYDSRINLDQPEEDIVKELIEADLRMKEQMGVPLSRNSLMLRAAKEIQKLRGF